VKLSILMPVYNEAETVEVVVKRVLDVSYPCGVELVIVDDGSSDATPALLARLDDPRVSVHTHPVNRGKGAAVRTAASKATGTHVVMCDADLEYSPEDLPALLRPVLEGEAEVVYGTRSFSSHTAFSFWFVLGNKGVTFIANALFDSWISDLETCFKLMPLPVYRSLDVRSAGFGMEAEITGKLLKQGVRPYEVPIRYRARSRAAGKKLTWRDGVEAVWILSRIRFGGQPGHRGR
jgi:glycosyltransferase involved in cell wall biosynthesis